MSMKPNRAVIAGAYAVALLLVLVPLSEMTLRVWPLRMAEPSWRFGAVGLFSNALMTPLLGLTFAGMLAYIYGHRVTIRTLAVLLGVSGLVITGAIGMFILDALQMRASVVPEAKLAFDVASAQALMKLGGKRVAAARLQQFVETLPQSETNRSVSRRPTCARVVGLPLPLSYARTLHNEAPLAG
jgi:hypothetical protein